MGRGGLRGLALAALVLSGCATATSSASGSLSGVAIRIQNATTVPVGLYVNGDWVGTYPVGVETTVPIGRAAEAPMTVELRSPSDAVLLRLTADERVLETARNGGLGAGEARALPCGVLTVIVGTQGQDVGLVPAESVAPGPCP